MDGSKERVLKALQHEKPDRTPLFEIFQPYQPIHWDICGRNLATDEAMAWDAMAGGVGEDEFIEASAKAQFEICKFFGLDMVRLHGSNYKKNSKPVKTGEKRWTLDGIKYIVNEKTKLVQPENPIYAYSQKISEDKLVHDLNNWDGNMRPDIQFKPDPVFLRFRQLAEKNGMDWAYMTEIGAGTGVAFYPPFMLMWMIDNPELYLRWLSKQKAYVFELTRRQLENGYDVVAMGGDVSCDKGPFISPAMYNKFILPSIKEHVDLIHSHGKLAAYTSDGNHWPIKDDFFFNSGIDGYKEVDKSAGMTWERMFEEGVAERICVIGNLDARYTMCNAEPSAAARETIECLEFGLKAKGGHILQLSHSVHEDVKIENYYAVINAYRKFFGLGRL